MNFSPFPRKRKMFRKNKGTRVNLKIPWDRLELSVEPMPSMAQIRREIISLASRGLEPDSDSQSNMSKPHGRSETAGRMSLPKRRRGATE